MLQSDQIKPSPEEKIKIMAQEAKEVESTSGGFMSPGTKVKAKRGPKGPWKNKGPGQAGGHESQQAPGQTGQTQAPKDHTDDLKPLVAPVWAMVDQAAQDWAGDQRAACGKDRMQILVQCTAQCINQYLPDMLGKHAPLCVLSVTMAQWALVVYAVRRDNLQKMEKERPVSGTNSPAGGTGGH